MGFSKQVVNNSVLMGWGSTKPYTSYLLYHSVNKLQDGYYNPEGYASGTVDAHLDAALNANDLDTAYENWKQAQGDGQTGTSMKGECPWVWLVNVQHLYYVRNGLDIGEQQLHAHGASWSLLGNLKEWSWQ
mgnify:CR=1 FL=1